MKQREILSAAIQQYLVAEMSHDTQPENFGVEALGVRQVADLDSEMVKPLELHAL